MEALPLPSPRRGRGDARPHGAVEVVWGRDEPMPLDEARSALVRAVAVVCASWRYGEILDGAPHLRTIVDVGGGFPPDLDYKRYFDRRIRVLSVAPAFGSQVAAPRRPAAHHP